MEIGKQSDNSPRFDQQLGTQSSLEQEKSAMIKAARGDLGCGYDRQDNHVGYQVFDISGFDETDFRVYEFKEGYNARIAASEKKATKTYNNAFKSVGNVSVVKGSGSLETSKVQKDQ